MKKDVSCPSCGEKIETWQNPKPTVDIIIEVDSNIVLIERANEPYGWALPGGFVDYGEALEIAAIREAKEETGLTVTLIRQFHVYSDPKRDPRQHNITIVFIARAEGDMQAGSDAKNVALFDKANLPKLAFDHADILNDYFSGRF
ncbi:ADP-ribose pyrophosphatase [hydrothermal vent metagenome]|uniref:ADP-ribose pyrophosphatase n=1 Tax=hydrothermal vent metagenome TaxID=652676 RepID=A0A3B1CFS0_9ZZZZ